MTESREVQRKNFYLNAAEGAAFASGSAFISPQTVLPALVVALGGSNVVVGFVGVILWVGLFLPQLFAARFVETLPWKKPWALGFGVAQRSVVLFMGLAVFFFGPSQPEVTLLLLLLLLLLNQILLGVATPGWFDLFAKLTPPRRRGRLFAVRNSIGGIGSFLCGLLLMFFLRTMEFPHGYALAFLCAFALQGLSILIQTKLVEADPSPVGAPRKMFPFLRHLPDVLRSNIAFRRFLGASAFLVIAVMPVSFFTVYALHKFDADKSVVAQFTLVMVAAQVVSAPLNGLLADRKGNKATIVLASCAMLVATLWALLAPSLAWFTVVFVFVGFNLTGDLMGRYNISVEYGPPMKRSTYIGLMNTILAPFYFASVAGGWISETFGYEAMFLAGATASVIGISFMMLKVVDPRSIHPNPS